MCRNAPSLAERGPCLVCTATLGLREERSHRHPAVAVWSVALLLLALLSTLIYVGATRL